MEVSIKEIEIQKLSLQPGEVLIVTTKIEDMDEHSMNALAEGLRTHFPNNKVALLALGTDDSIRFTVVKEVAKPDMSCASSPVGYCSDCNCGKREQVEGAKS